MFDADLRGEWGQLSPLLDQALELPPGERAPWVASLPPGLSVGLESVV